MSNRAQPYAPLKEPIAITCHLARADRQYFAGETFRATLRFRNDAPYGLEKLTYMVEIQTPSQRRITLHKSTAGLLGPSEQREAIVEHRLSEPNEYYFRVSATYTDFTGEYKSHNASPLRIMAPKALDESLRKVHMLKAAPSSASSGLSSSTHFVASASSPSVPEPTTGVKYLVTIAIINKASTTVRLTNIRFIPRDSMALVVTQPTIALNPIERTSHGEAMPLATGYDELAPYDTIRFVAEVAIRKPNVGGAAGGGAAAPSDAIFFSSSAASVSTSHIDLGHFEWAWSRESDIKGQDASALFRVARGPAEPEVNLQVVGIYPPSPAAGDAVTLTLQVTNNHLTEKKDVSVATHIARLLPYFVYNGPLLTALGTVGPKSSVITHITVIAHYPGYCPVVGCFELRDTARPEVTLWPVFPNTTGGASTVVPSTVIGGPPSQFIGGGPGQRLDAQITQTLNITAAEGWPPKLADIFITYRSPTQDDESEEDDGESVDEEDAEHDEKDQRGEMRGAPASSSSVSL